MEAIDILKKRWNEGAHLQPFHPALSMTDEGLFLGAGTRLAPMIQDRFGASVVALQGNEERILTLLSFAYQKTVSTDVLKFIKRASMQWALGDKELAHLELAMRGCQKLKRRKVYGCSFAPTVVLRKDYLLVSSCRILVLIHTNSIF